MWKTLISAEQLAGLLGSERLVVVDATTSVADPDAAEADYREGHIPGAHFADLPRDLSGAHTPGAGRHPWPDDAHACAVLGRWGVTPEHQVVVYDGGDGALAAARAWFVLRTLGHERVAVLDGGLARWRALALPLERSVPAPSAGAPYRGRFDRSRLLDSAQVQAHLADGGMLIDARAAERFRGEYEHLDRAAGHVPGARSRPFVTNLRDGRFKPAEELAAEFRALLGDMPAERTAVMCGSGVTACHHLLAMEHAGLPGAKLFTGSWSGWLEDPARPIARGAD
ncbi:MAG TPA: sulfurtransferase [Lysobacter sp.]|nr:sulfurtransferase [Lysobacter sp.]